MQAKQRIDIPKNIGDWLASERPPVSPTNERDVKIFILKAASMMGYAPPFNDEQNRINALLFRSKATKTQCLSAWAYYHDVKMVEASTLKPSAIAPNPYD